GCLLGFLTTILEIYKFSSIIAIFTAIFIYIISTIILKFLLKKESRIQLGRKLYLTGSGTYGALWLLTWIISYNLLGTT
ncbi:MAG: hypothetical protein NZ929_04000, partial [Aigarchaeota archaeon]|nr:hypothetical protein [Aigarchaeota archaeon]